MFKLNGCFVTSDALIKIRLSVYMITLCHLILSATYLLGLDYSKSRDPQLQAYVTLKWKLLTAWFNLLQGPYLLICIVCEWYNWKHQETSKYVDRMNECRHFIFSSILAPMTMFGDVMFWCLYNKDKSLLMPLSADEFVSVWNHHSMHTVTLLFVLFEIVSVPRKRPKDMRPAIITLMSFVNLYSLVCVHSALNGQYVYPMLEIFPLTKIFIGFLYFHIASLFYYTGQWVIVDIIWGTYTGRKN